MMMEPEANITVQSRRLSSSRVLGVICTGKRPHVGEMGLLNGFTLVELLVTVTIIVLLVAILLPALAQAHATVQTVHCTSNLRQMQTGWLMFIQGGRGRIPYVYQTWNHPNWEDAMNTVFPDAPVVYDNNLISFATCPTIQKTVPMMHYFRYRYGYAINWWWADAGTEAFDQAGSSAREVRNWKAARSCDMQMWVDVHNPSRHPWFMDPEVLPYSPGSIGAPDVPYFPANGPNWGVGAPHDDERITNVSFADGSARSVPILEIQNNLDGPNSFAWLSNR